ncbi:MAG TPA: hypothetical protein VLR45_10815 [Desulfoprunum sp.]|nr:hypothetical protein [Desulfoprunum sp.]
MDDITKILSFEVKKEIAERYFGFRKRIEDDTGLYQQRLTASTLELESSIGFDLIRIYILLHDEHLIHRFIDLVGLPQEFFYDPYFVQSASIRRRVFSGMKSRGWSRRSRFRNMFYSIYESLAGHIESYRKTLSELTEEQETIREQINLFYRRNDIDSIMSFIRRIDNPDPSELTASSTIDAQHGLDEKMRLHPPLPACDLLPTISPLPALADIRPHLKQLIDEAYTIPRKWRLRDEILPIACGDKS